VALSSEERARIAELWISNGLSEHASVASFARFALQLMHFGSPPRFLLAAAEAMKDEIRHAQLCFGLAAHFSAGRLMPGALDTTDSGSDNWTIASIVQSVIIEGCVSETLAVAYARRAMIEATDFEVRAVLEQIVSDEERHSDLAWDFVEWIVSAHPELRGIVQSSFVDAIDRVTKARFEDVEVPAGFGIISASQRAAVRDELVAGLISQRMACLVRENFCN
jgi:hypothetical protein